MTKYKLYYMAGACSLAAHVALREIGADFELENVRQNKANPQERPTNFLKINPRGNVPVLEIVESGGQKSVLREGVAILLHLLDNHKNDLLPKSGNERDEVLEWLCFANSSLHPTYSRIFAMHRLLAQKATENELYDPFIAAIQKNWDDIENHLQNHEFLAGKKMSIADILITVIANWSPAFKKPINFGEKTTELFKKVKSRESFAKAMEIEGVFYKVA